MSTVLTVLNVLGGLAVFLYGMKLMSDGLQKMAGNSMRKLLAAATTNRYTATLSGIIVTGIIQSSSATTVMVVGFTSAGLLTLNQALGVIFGANIGTTMTAWVVSFFGFKMSIALFALPVLAIGFFIQFIGKWKTLHRIGEAMVGFGFLFLGLDLMKNAIPDFSQSPEMMAWLSQFRPTDLLSILLLVLIGAALTVILQSSSAVMAMTITCAAKGFIDFPTAAALVLGENIGTTITANLAAIGGNKAAKRAALGHFLFNFIGVVWVVAMFHPFVSFVDWLIPGSPYGTDEKTLTEYIPYHISAFHTVFNLINTFVMLFFIRYLARLATWIIPETKRENRNSSELIFINSRFASAPELALEAARKEIERMTGLVSKMLNKLTHAMKVEDDDMFEQLVKDAKALEKDTDVMEYKINTYLTSIAHERISSTLLDETMSLIDIINSVERMGDSGEKIADILVLARQNKEFSEEDKDNIDKIASKVKDAVKDARYSLLGFDGPKKRDLSEFISNAYEREREINALRQELRDARNMQVIKRDDLTAISSTHFSDIISRFERIADHALRVIDSSISKKTPEKERADANSASVNRKI
ncbi:phosphate:Na+ symporter [Parelusimicrobium proximum]|uniref:Na/Pi cotransporter family protein n=1 Tax=Parelusimicrobium proximum TaxID=3228953 RepID=UPI003D173F7D